MHILIERDDGGVSVLALAPGIEAAVEVPRWEAAFQRRAVQWAELTDAPTDRAFRAAWVCGAPGAVAVDLGAARDIHLARIRKARDRALVATDGEAMRALDTGEGSEGLHARRQSLRDIPQALDLTVASTPGELKAIWPSEIERRAVRRA